MTTESVRFCSRFHVLGKSAPARIPRSLNPASCDSSYRADPNHHKPSAELFSQKQRRLQRRSTWSSPNNYVFNFPIVLFANTTDVNFKHVCFQCNKKWCFPLPKCFLNVSKHCSNAVFKVKPNDILCQ